MGACRISLAFFTISGLSFVKAQPCTYLRRMSVDALNASTVSVYSQSGQILVSWADFRFETMGSIILGGFLGC